jgi:glucosyl-3-phosphoglycerate synthase
MLSPNQGSIATFSASDFSRGVLSDRNVTVSVCIPVRNEAETIGAIVALLVEMRTAGLIDQVVVVDAASTDDSASIAARHGADVFDQSALMAAWGPVKGKGDAIWRSLSVLTGDIACFFDGDLTSFSPEYVLGLAGGLVSNPHLSFLKAAFSRPFRDSSGDTSGEGGRVTEGMAEPMLDLFYPALTVFGQPLSGQFAISRPLLGSLPMSTGYGVDVGLLIDVYQRVGPGAMGEVDIGPLYNAHQTLGDLEPMAYQVGLAIVQRLETEGRLANTERAPYTHWDGVSDDSQQIDLAIETRPPFDSLAATRQSLD